MSHSSNYDKHPRVQVPDSGGQCARGWEAVCGMIKKALRSRGAGKTVVTVECYTGVFEAEIRDALSEAFPNSLCISSADGFRESGEIESLVAPFNGGDDPVFGRLTNLRMKDFLDAAKVRGMQQAITEASEPVVWVVGPGASLVHSGDILIYADLARWEAQLRMRRDEISNLACDNRQLKWSLQYKRAFFTDWRVCDHLKQELIDRWDFVLDTHRPGDPRLATGEAVRKGLRETAHRPFRVVPFFDPGPWGGQWMRKVCDLDPEPENFAWCFDCVPEENSLLLDFAGVVMEVPSINVVFHQPRELLGERVFCALRCRISRSASISSTRWMAATSRSRSIR